jgi:uncharacterized protein (DUF58 family)
MQLTERALVLVALAGGCQIAGMWLDEPGLGRIALVLVIVLAGGLAGEALRRRGRVPAIALDAGSTVLGDDAGVELRATTDALESVLFEYLPSVPGMARADAGTRALAVSAGEVALDRYVVTPMRLGRHPLPPLVLRVLGAYGLAFWPARIPVEATLVVRPGRLSADERRRATAAGGTVAQRHGAGTELVQLRPYRPGDAPRAIDWRATARTGALVSREFGEDRHLEVVMLIDAGRQSRLGIDGSDRYGHYANVAARLAERAVIDEDRVGLLVFADRLLARLPAARGAPALQAVREALTCVEVAEADSDLLGAALAARRMIRVRSLIVLFTDLDDPRGAGQLFGAVTLLKSHHQVLVAGLRSARVSALSRRMPARQGDAYAGIAADARLDAMAATVSRLRLAGIPAVLAEPAHYERAVFRGYDDLKVRRRV